MPNKETSYIYCTSDNLQLCDCLHCILLASGEDYTLDRVLIQWQPLHLSFTTHDDSVLHDHLLAHLYRIDFANASSLMPA